ncbi:hypothetical protein [Thalassococcus sp. S3]|uniref:hypothetical protein n=1 Tax=Thalassococcus sp. S3 TaxID=2017482 RepID=UPI0010244D17|nr:hypothetical protein [Thalassococcus sp. S3]QBF33413.1 hypothetical protein CFI11_19675 [Thalassococcus sp. S3]
MTCLIQTADAAPLPDGDPVSLAIIHQDVKDVLQDFSLRIGIPIGVSPDVSGIVRDLKGSFAPRDFLDRLSTRHKLTWYYDGDIIHVTPVSANRTLLIELGLGDFDALARTLNDLEIADDRYVVRRTPDARVARLSGPPAFVNLVEKTVGVLPSSTPKPPAAVQNPPTVPSRPRFCIGC